MLWKCGFAQNVAHYLEWKNIIFWMALKELYAMHVLVKDYIGKNRLGYHCQIEAVNKPDSLCSKLRVRAR